MKRIYIPIIYLLLAACGKSKTAEPAVTPPGKAVLVTPAQNEACTTGTVVFASDTESTVQFSWLAGSNTDSYEVFIKNLLSNTTISNTTTANSLSVKLLRNTPFSWYVVSKSAKTTATAQSDTWKFYNSGPGTTSYAPYPADVISPSYDQQIAAANGKVNLQWKGTDADNDISKYDVHLGTTSTPAVFQRDINALSLEVSVVSGSTYYWKIITKDSKGNTSDSGVYKFRVN